MRATYQHRRKHPDTCCICFTRPRRETISGKTGKVVRQRTCKECHAEYKRKLRERSLITVLPEGFWDWEPERAEKWITEWFRRMLRRKDERSA